MNYFSVESGIKNMIIVLKVNAPMWAAQEVKEALAMDLEKYGDVQVVEIRDERERTEQLSMSGLQKGRYK